MGIKEIANCDCGTCQFGKHDYPPDCVERRLADIIKWVEGILPDKRILHKSIKNELESHENYVREGWNAYRQAILEKLKEGKK